MVGGEAGAWDLFGGVAVLESREQTLYMFLLGRPVLRRTKRVKLDNTEILCLTFLIHSCQECGTSRKMCAFGVSPHAVARTPRDSWP